MSSRHAELEKQYADQLKEVERLQQIARAAHAELHQGFAQNLREHNRQKAAARRLANENKADRAWRAEQDRARREAENHARRERAREEENERKRRAHFNTSIKAAQDAADHNSAARLRRIQVGSVAFQEWMRDIFAKRPMPSYLRHMVLPPGVSALQQLERISSSNGANFEDPCAQAPEPGRSSIQVHQAVVSVMAQLRAENRISTAGLLVMHSTGAGKTVIGLSVLLAYWNKTYTKNGRKVPVPVFFVSTNDNQVTNSVQRLAEYALIFFPGFEALHEDGTVTRPFSRPPGYTGSGAYWRDPQVIKLAADSITRRLKHGLAGVFIKDFGQKGARVMYTYATLGIDLRQQRIPTKVSNAVFIVDEIQYLISPPPAEATYAPDYKMVWQVLARERDVRSTWVVGMTATPGETREELVAIMNAVMGPLKNRMKDTDSVDQLRSKARGYVSYAFLLGDRSRFARVNLKLMCSYLQHSYYHDPFFRRLHAEFHQYPKFQGGANFIRKSIIENRGFGEIWPNLNKMSARKSPNTIQKNTESPAWTYHPEKADAYLRTLRRLTLFIELRAAHEMDHLERRLNPEHEDYIKYNANTPFHLDHPWLIQELFFSPKGSPAPRQANAGNNANNANTGNTANTAVHRVNQALLNRQMQLAEASTQRRSSRVAALTRHAIAEATRPSASTAPKPRALQPHAGFFRFLLSPKIPQLLRFIYKDITSAPGSSTRGIHFVYTSDRRAALLLAKTLESVLKLPQLKRARDVSATKQPYFVMIDRVKSDVRILEPYLTQKSNIRGRMEGQEGLLSLVSSDKNYKGDIVKVVIATDKSFKGVDLRNIRYLHLLDPFVNFRDFIQFVGRGPRNCSHSQFKVKDRQVDVLLYRLVYSQRMQCESADKALPDCFVWNQSFDRYISGRGFKTLEDEVLWKASVDYLVFKDNLHKSRDELMTMIRNTKVCADDTGAPTGFQSLAKAAYTHQIKFVRQRLRNKHGIGQLRKLKMKKYRATKRNFNAQYKQNTRRAPLFGTGLYRRDLAASLENLGLGGEHRRHTFGRDLADLQKKLKSVERRLENKPNNAQLAKNKAAAQHAIQNLRNSHAEEARFRNYTNEKRREFASLRKRGINVTVNNIRNNLAKRRRAHMNS